MDIICYDFIIAQSYVLHKTALRKKVSQTCMMHI